ncbi:MAG: hypothetical protein IH946_00855 [Bacteroidetes bacterium]|nr:hypothetical protein [Bacteroidota bacterium]
MRTGIVTLLLIWASIAFTQTTNHWETVIYFDDTFSYFEGNSEPDTDWRLLSFNDSLWLTGQGGIGFGDNDDNTTVSPVRWLVKENGELIAIFVTSIKTSEKTLTLRSKSNSS